MISTRTFLGFIVMFATLALATAVFAHDDGDENDSQQLTNLKSDEWTEINDDAAWTRRAGLQVIALRGKFYLMGGRTPRPPADPPIPGDSDIWGDVWCSDDRGKTWQRILETDDENHWPARAYFKALKKGRRMYVLGGQNYKLIPNPRRFGPPFISVSDFFNDVWCSRDGINWEQRTANAGWAGRAGMMAVTFDDKLWVMGGSINDDAAIVGGPPKRIYFNDVWSSPNGRVWRRHRDAPWAPRAGGVLVVKDGYIYLLGGEDGFLCQLGGRCPPYYNDVWRTKDGRRWELVTEAADWSPRPGHQAVVLKNQIVLFGGFGLSPDRRNPFEPANPMDMWVSETGFEWEQISDSPWNATSPSDIKYDFAAVVAPGRDGVFENSIYTFGGDRETFDFNDLTNYLNVDNDVWEFAAPTFSADFRVESVTTLHLNSPNPFNPTTTITFELAGPERVTLQIFDVSGRLVRTLIDDYLPAASHSRPWDGRNAKNEPVASGVYFYRLSAGTFLQTKKMILLK